ncbi:dockerin type I repeat-containing protein [bacterium]|nr:dockerin type I repeat-containing protein [candidate division CSSED10-310 bacterium]
MNSIAEKTSGTGLGWIVWIAGMMVCTAVSAEALKPDWIVGSWWDYTTVNDIHMQETGSAEYLDITLTDENTRHMVTGIENRTLTQGTPLSYQAYILPFSGSIEGEGTYHITEPFPMDVPVELRNGILSGEWWIDVVTMATIYHHRSIQGELWADVLGSWTEVGTVDLMVSEEYEPGRLWADFPLEVGNGWLQDITFFTYGNYMVDGEILGQPFHEEDAFNESFTYQLDVDVVSEETAYGYMTYRMEGVETGSSGAILTHYGPVPKALVYDALSNFGGSGSVQVDAITKTLTGYHLEPGPATPTPTQGACIHDGDVTLDGEITAGDAQVTFLIALGSYTPTYEEECAADCNGDGEVTAGDAQGVFLVALGSSPSCADPL